MRGLTELEAFIARHDRLFVLTGAGCSTPSGIPDYRDVGGRWKRTQPIAYQAFMSDIAVRRRYWARSLLGWRMFQEAEPNAAHRALARLEGMGKSELLLTQNVDRLHQAAGSERVIDLHGRLDHVRCMGCGDVSAREDLQARLERQNPTWVGREAPRAPDGDADLDVIDFLAFEIPSCRRCDGVLKPDVVFFGESVPRERVETAYGRLDAAEAMLVVGSSLMVYSGFRFVEHAVAAGKPVAAVNLGRTRADHYLTLKVEAPCESALDFLL
jgi:NAD-dependent SIR2 family protein deacetylase